MNGKQLYDYYVSKRDHSGSSEDDYADTLGTMRLYMRKAIYPLLERAEKEGKKLDIVYPEGILIDEIDESMIIFV